MAIQNPPNMFSLGAVELDSSQSTNLYAQLAARKQAKEDAIDEYYKKLPSTLNSAGMRDNDRAGFDQAIGEWQKFWMQNKDKIRKGNTQEAFEAEQRFRTIQGKINESKEKAKTGLTIGEMRLKGEKGYIFDDDTFMKTLNDHELPIWDPNHKGIDLATITLPTEPYTQEKQDKLWTSVTKGVTPGKQYNYDKQYANPKTGQVIVPFQKTFSEDQIGKIADQAAALVKEDKSARAHYNKILNAPTSESFDELQAAYSKYYKGIVDTPEKAAAAEAIIRATVPQEVGEEQEINYSQRQADRIQTIILRDNLSDGNRGSGSGSGAIISGNEFDRFPTPKTGWSGKKKLTADQIPAQTQAILKTAGIDISDAVSFDVEEKDGVTQSITPVWEDKDGKLHRDKTIYRKDMENAQLKYNTEAQKGQQPSFGNNSNQQPSGKTYKYNGKTYTQEQINKAAKQAGLTPDQYLKKLGY